VAWRGTRSLEPWLVEQTRKNRRLWSDKIKRRWKVIGIFGDMYAVMIVKDRE
jgi:hypothetical protein